MTLTTETPNTQANSENTQEQKSGVQARIDEMTAQKYELQERLAQADRRYAEMAQKQLELEQRMQQAQASAQPQTVSDPLAQFREHVDPKVLEAIQAQQDAAFKRFQQEQATRMRQIETQNALMQLQQIATQPGIPPEVAQQASNLLRGWQQAGYNFVTAQDALHMALGQYSAGQLRKAAPSMQFQQANIPTVTPGQQPPVQVQRGPSRPANFDSLSPAKQMEYLIAAGIEDQPL